MLCRAEQRRALRCFDGLQRRREARQMFGDDGERCGEARGAALGRRPHGAQKLHGAAQNGLGAFQKHLTAKRKELQLRHLFTERERESLS